MRGGYLIRKPPTPNHHNHTLPLSHNRGYYEGGWNDDLGEVQQVRQLGGGSESKWIVLTMNQVGMPTGMGLNIDVPVH